jgi:protein SCO1/2
MKKPFVLLVLFGLLVSCDQAEHQPLPVNQNKAIVMGSQQLPELSIYNLPSSWTTQDSKEIKLEDLKGDVLVVAMIYTSCTTACPRLMADMLYIEGKIPKEDLGNVKFVIVSIDPETDTPQRLNEFAHAYNLANDRWVFLRGTPEDTREFATVLAVSYKKISPMEFSHSNIISVFDEQGVMTYQKEGLDVDYDRIVDAVKKEIHD